MDPIELALQNMTDHVAFERLCRRVLAGEGRDVDPRGGASDAGRDALEGGSAAVPKTIIQISLQEDVNAKLKDELHRYTSGAQARPEEYMYMTNQRASSSIKDRFTSAFGEADIRLVIADLDWLSTRLTQPKHQDLRDGLLAQLFIKMPQAVTFMLRSPLRQAALAMLDAGARESLLDAQLAQARAFLSGRRWTSARDVLLRVLAESGLTPKQRFEALTHLGNAQFNLGANEEAKKCWRAASDLGLPNQTPSANLANLILLIDGDAVQARSIVGRGLSRDPRNAVLINLLGLLDYDNPAKALALFREAFSTEAVPEFLLNEWGLREEHGPEVTNEEVEAALKRFPKHKGVALFAANRQMDMFQLHGRVPRHLVELEKLLSPHLLDVVPQFRPAANPDGNEPNALDREWAACALNTVAAAAYWTDEFGEADRLIRLALSYGDAAVLHMSLGQMLAASGRVADALPAYTAALERRHNSSDVWCQIGNAHYVLFKRGGDRSHLTAATEAYERAVEGNREVLVNLAQLRWELGDYAGARSTIESALEANPDNPLGLINRINYRVGANAETTLAELKSLEPRFPMDPNVLTAIGEGLYRLLRWGEAYSYLERARQAAGPNAMLLEQIYPLAAVALKRYVGGEAGTRASMDYVLRGLARLPGTRSFQQLLDRLARGEALD